MQKQFLSSKTTSSFIATGSFALSLAWSFAVGPALAAPAPDITPEVVSRVWLEDGSQIGSVILNGEEVARFKTDEDDDDAAEEAEELAIKLQELVHDKKFDVTSLLPGRDEDKASLKADGNTVLSFDPLLKKDDDEDNDSKKSKANPTFEASLRLCNAIRIAFGASILPSGFSESCDKSSSKLELLGHTFSGHASWYGGRFNGRKCSDGSRFSEEKLTAAHRSLPFGTKLLVKNRKTGDSCIVEVNDRGPFIGGRVIDLSKAAAKQLKMIGSGVAFVDCQILAANERNLN